LHTQHVGTALIEGAIGPASPSFLRWFSINEKSTHQTVIHYFTTLGADSRMRNSAIKQHALVE
jgi:hypothetical protein